MMLTANCTDRADRVNLKVGLQQEQGTTSFTAQGAVTPLEYRIFQFSTFKNRSAHESFLTYFHPMPSFFFF